VSFAREVVPRLAIPIGAMAVTGAGAALLLGRRKRASAKPAGGASFENPFSLRAALIFGALFAGTLLLVRASQAWLGARGMFLAAGLSGLVDVDAISIALARGAGPGAAGRVVVAIVIATISNNLFKAGIAVVTGRGRFRMQVAIALGVMAAAGGIAAAACVAFGYSVAGS